MLGNLRNAITALLKSALPTLFTGAGAVVVSFVTDDWTFDPSSLDPVAGEPGPEDAADRLAFDPAAPAGPYLLTRPPYPGPRRVYLRSAAGERVALLPSELSWSASDPRSFGVQLRAGRDASGFNQLEIHYGVVAAGTRLKVMHQLAIAFASGDAGKLEQALVLGLAVLALNRETLRAQAAFSFSAGNWQADGRLKTLGFVSGSSPAGSGHRLVASVEIDLRVQRLLGPDEGKPIERIVSPGREAGTKAIDIDPAVQA